MFKSRRGHYYRKIIIMPYKDKNKRREYAKNWMRNRRNSFDVNVLKVLQTWITYWVLPATIYQLLVFEEIK